MGLEMIQTFFTPNKTVFYVDLPLKMEKNNTNKKDTTTIIINKNELIQ